MAEDFFYAIDIFDPRGDALVTSVRLNQRQAAAILRCLTPDDDPETTGAVYTIQGFFGARAVTTPVRRCATGGRGSRKASAHK